MEYYDLGDYTRKITTSSKDAQLWFDRGLAWTYGYNHEEAINCFRKAIAADSGCAMAYWGIAYCIGPNYNKPWEGFEEDEKPDCIKLAKSSIEAATALLDQVSPVERALIEADTSRKRRAEVIDHVAAAYILQGLLDRLMHMKGTL